MIMPLESASALVDTYQELTKERLPEQAQAQAQADDEWPVRFDHCFQRIVLDAVCDDEWYGHIESPAYKNMTEDQLVEAIKLAQSMIDDPARCKELNVQSLTYRGKQGY